MIKDRLKYIFKYIIIFLFSIIVAKYVMIWFLPPSKTSKTPITTDSVASVESSFQEITLNIDLTPLREIIDNDYEIARQDIHTYIEREIERQREIAYYNLSKDDGFLDWVFGWWTGYKIMYKKIKGLLGSDDNEIKMVAEKFQNDVISPNFSTMISNIEGYAANRTQDFYKSAIVNTSKYLNKRISEIKRQGYRDIEMDPVSVPWSKYIISTSSDGFALLELTGVTGVSTMVGKFVGAKIATLIGPKMLSLVGTKAAAAIGSKIAASFSLIFAPLVDYLINASAKEVMYDKTKKEFEAVIDDILETTKKEIIQHVDQALLSVKNDIYQEINKQVTLKAVK